MPPTGRNCKQTQDWNATVNRPLTQVSNDSSSDVSLVTSDVEDSKYNGPTESIQVKILEELQKVNKKAGLSGREDGHRQGDYSSKDWEVK